MTCVHLKKLYDLCQTNHLQISSSELVRIVCQQCGIEEVCPSVGDAEYGQRHPEPRSTDSAEEAQSCKS